MAGRTIITVGDGWRTELDVSGFERLRTSPRVTAEVMKRAWRVAAACGDGFTAEHAPSKRRARATVQAVTWEAKHREAEHNLLLRNLDAAG